MMKKQVQFLKNAIIGKQVGAVSRSSKYVIARILEILEGEELNTVIEYGPGDGVLTRELLKIIPKKGRLLVVEFDPNFVKILKKIKDPRLQIVSAKWRM